MKWFIKCFQHYADFKGRARRKEYWMFTLFNSLFSILLYIVDVSINSPGIFQSIYTLVVLLPGLAVCVRRLHDIGKSGWWYFICLIPVVGSIWLVVLFCLDSDGYNKYGDNPKYEA